MRTDSEFRGCDTAAVMRTATGACLLALASRAATDGAKAFFPLVQTEMASPSPSYLYEPVSREKPAAAGAMPASFENGQVAFMELRLGDGEPLLIAVVAHLPRRDRSGFRVYLDRNGNRALADEISCETSEDPKLRCERLQYTPPISVPVVYHLPSGEARRTCRFRLGFCPIPPNSQQGDERLFYNAQFVALQGWSGPVRFGNKTVRLTLLDGDGDAKMQVQNPVSRDLLRLEGASLPRAQEEQSLTRCLDIDGVLYRLEVQPDGAKVAVSRYTEPLGAVAWDVSSGRNYPAALSMLSFAGANLSVSSQGVVPTSRAIPAGDYYYLTYRVGKEAPTAHFRTKTPISVSAGVTNRIACGGPVIVNGSVSQLKESGVAALYVSVTAANAAGHVFQLIGSRQAGRIEVLGPGGVPAGSGNMEYG